VRKGLGFEAERPLAALEDDPTVFADQIETIWPAAIRRSDCILDAVDDHGQLQAEVGGAGGGDRFSLFLRLRLVHRDLRATILRKDPSFFRVRLTNVNNEKVDASRLTSCELLERSNLGAERWSGVRAEDERHRQLVEERPEANRLLAVDAR
jgi:hypothetical protein